MSSVPSAPLSPSPARSPVGEPGAGQPAAAGGRPVWLWALQILIFLGGGPLFLFPALTFPLFLGHPIRPEDHLRVAMNSFALLGVHATSIGVFTVYALMAGEAEPRRRYARVFALFFTMWVGVLATNLAQSWAEYGAAAKVLLPVGALLAVGNAAWAFRRLPGDRAPFGDVASAPPWSFAMWLGFAAATTAAGAVILLAPGAALSALISGHALEVNTIAIQQTRFTGTYLVGYGALCVVAAFTTRAAIWRPMAAVLAFWPLSAIALAMVLWDQQTYSWVSYLALVLLGVLGLGNLKVARAPATSWAEDVSLPLRGWIPPDLVSGPMMAVQTLMTKRRASHLVGVGARGTLSTVAAEGRPAHDFFQDGRSFRLVARFANLTERDDASLDVRGGSISVVSDAGERFDMVMNTGSSAPVRHLVDFAMFVGSKFLPTFGSKLIVKSSRRLLEGGIVGLRRAPDSFANLYFHSQIVRWWFTPEGDLNLVRYRLAPVDLGPESGLPDSADVQRIWDRDRLAGDERPRDYLRRELAERLGRGPVRFRFQAQFKPSEPDLDLQWYDASVDWPEADQPWIDVGVVELVEALGPDATEQLDFLPLHHPPSCGIPPSSGIFDPRSLGDSEVRVMAALQRLRAGMYRALGLPKVSA